MTERMLHHLPVGAYTEWEWFRREQEMIFSRTWAYAGFAEDVPEPGRYVSVQAGLNNIFVVMGRDRRLRAFHNLCRHRGTQLLRTVGKAPKTITCPYHDWTYDLEGRLLAIPGEQREFHDVDKACLGLKPAAVGRWRGMLFVHPEPHAAPVAEWFAAVEPYLGPHAVDSLIEYPQGRASYEIEANWKIVVENYIDVYHLARLHSGTLAMYDHAKAAYRFVGPHYVFREPLAAAYAADIEQNAPAPVILPHDRLAAYVPMLFPGIGLAETESSWSTFIVTPLAPDRTRVENRTRVKDASAWTFARQERRSAKFWKRAVRGKYAAGEEGDAMTSGDFTAEDVYVCEQQQKALRSPYFEVGPVSRGERPVLEHQKVVLRFLEGRG